MTSSVTEIASKTERNTSLIPLIEFQGVPFPAAPENIHSTGISKDFLSDLALKTAQQVPQCTTHWVAEKMRMPISIVDELLQDLAHEQMLEILRYESVANYAYQTTNRGHERAMRLLAMSQYVGPAPVSIDSYASLVKWQHHLFHATTLNTVKKALSGLSISERDIEILALATVSERSLFLWGPPGNGKTTVAQSLHRAFEGELWIPYCLGVGNDVIKVFDANLHEITDQSNPDTFNVDRRWIRIRRPLIITGGEMTLESLELAYTTGLGHYEVPPHIKANGGLFVIDDFGRQLANPWKLLNRWIVPMEEGYDYFTLINGRRITLPFKQMVIIATNINPNKVMDSAFLRRMGYRLKMDTPSAERYREIFETSASQHGLQVPSGLIDRLIDRYQAERRTMRGCEPRDLIRRVQDICQLREIPLQLNDEMLDLAWVGYFGSIPENSDSDLNAPDTIESW